MILRPLRFRNGAAAGICALAIALTSSHARAGGEAVQPQQIAEAHFKTGLKLYEQGSYEGARLEFLQAQAVYPRPSLLRNLALCELKTNRPLDAIVHLRAYLADPNAEKRDYAKKSFEEAFARTGHIAVRATDGAILAVDGQPILGAAPFKEAVDVMPGHHSIEARLGDRSATREVEAAAGSVVDADLRFEEKAVTPPPPSPKEAGTTRISPPQEYPPSELSTPSHATRNIVVGALAVTSLVAIGVGVGYTVAANNASDDLARAKSVTGGDSSQVCSTSQSADCDARSQAADSLATNTNVARVLFIGGGALAVSALVLGLVWPTANASSRTGRNTYGSSAKFSPWIGTGGAGFSFGKEF